MNITQPGSQSPTTARKRSALRWIIPLVLVLFGGPILAVGGCVYWGLSALNAPINAAVETLNSSPEITSILGTPIKSGSSKNISDYNNHNGNGGATVAFNAIGPNGSANVDGKMQLNAGNWAPDGLTITFGDGTKTTLGK